MRIALFCTSVLPTPPPEKETIHASLWITWHLAEGLVARGHDVTVFGSKDSKTSARLVSYNIPSLKKNKKFYQIYQKIDERWKANLRNAYNLSLSSQMFREAQKGSFDIIHLHTRPESWYLSRLVDVPVVLTLHDPLTYPDETGLLGYLHNSLKDASNLSLVSISNSQRNPKFNLSYAGTVYNGIDIENFSFSNNPGKYLAFSGRMLPWKGPHIAVQIARKMNKKLKLVGEIPADRKQYWDSKIKPYLSKNITYEGFLGKKEIKSFYKEAEVLLMPINWQEPFGLVMIEAMACGTPVIAFKRGSVPEVVKDKKTGFVVKTIDQMVSAIKKIDQIERKNCRDWVEKRFTNKIMVDNYEKVYRKIIAKYKKI